MQSSTQNSPTKRFDFNPEFVLLLNHTRGETVENKIDIDRHPFQLTSYNPAYSGDDPKVLGHFSNLDLAVFTAAQRRRGRNKYFVNGVLIEPVALRDALENYGQEEGAEVCDNG